MFHTQSFWVWRLRTLLTWNNHIYQLISRLNSACYAIRAVNAMLSRKALGTLHFSCSFYHIIFGVIPLIVLKYSESIKMSLRIMNRSKKMNS